MSNAWGIAARTLSLNPYSTNGEDLIVVETEIVGGCWDLHTSVTIDGTTRTVTCE